MRTPKENAEAIRPVPPLPVPTSCTQPAASTRHGRRQCTLPELCRICRTTGTARQTVRYAGLHQPQPQYLRRKYPVTPIYAVDQLLQQRIEIMPERVRKPEWLKISIGANERYTETKRIVESHCLHTICSSGRCPNMGECWGKGTATFMIGGNICTRCCKFCNTASGKPLPLDADEPTHVAESIALMKLSHAVVTSVDRDDLPDLGASHWVRTIREIKRLNPDTTVEVLIPDFQGRKELVAQVIDAQPEIISHNMETVRRISPSCAVPPSMRQAWKCCGRLQKAIPPPSPALWWDWARLRKKWKN